MVKSGLATLHLLDNFTRERPSVREIDSLCIPSEAILDLGGFDANVRWPVACCSIPGICQVGPNRRRDAAISILRFETLDLKTAMAEGNGETDGRGRLRKMWIAGLGAAGVVILILSVYVSIEFDLITNLSAESVTNWIKRLGYWGVLVSIGLMIGHSFLPFPAEVVAIANGMVYGPLWGTVITWSGAMLGAVVAFLLSRKLGRPFLLKLMRADHVRRLDELAEVHGPMTIFLARFVPLIAFNLVNFAAGLTRMPMWVFVVTTGIGILPFTVIFVWLGHGILEMSWDRWIGLVAGGAVLWFLLRRVVVPRKEALPIRSERVPGDRAPVAVTERRSETK